MDTEGTLRPDITMTDGRISYRSRIRFKMASESAGLVERMRDSGSRQVIWDDTAPEFAYMRPIVESGVCWPASDEDWLVLEITVSGPREEAQTVQLRHDAMIPAHVRGLRASHGDAKVIGSEDT